MLDQLLSPACVESVSVRHKAQANWPIDHFESKATGVQIIVDRNTHPCECGEVENRSTRRRKIEIEETNGSFGSEDDVLQTHVVVADDGPSCEIRQFITPNAQPNRNLG